MQRDPTQGDVRMRPSTLRHEVNVANQNLSTGTRTIVRIAGISRFPIEYGAARNNGLQCNPHNDAITKCNIGLVCTVDICTRDILKNIETHAVGADTMLHTTMGQWTTCHGTATLLTIRPA